MPIFCYKLSLPSKVGGITYFLYQPGKKAHIGALNFVVSFLKECKLLLNIFNHTL